MYGRFYVRGPKQGCGEAAQPRRRLFDEWCREEVAVSGDDHYAAYMHSIADMHHLPIEAMYASDDDVQDMILGNPQLTNSHDCPPFIC